VEGTRERIQVFEGVVIAVNHAGLRQNVTVRRVTHGVGVERTFLVHSPRIDKIEVLSVASIIADALRAVFEDRSVSEIFGGANQA